MRVNGCIMRFLETFDYILIISEIAIIGVRFTETYIVKVQSVKIIFCDKFFVYTENKVAAFTVIGV